MLINSWFKKKKSILVFVHNKLCLYVILYTIQDDCSWIYSFKIIRQYKYISVHKNLESKNLCKALCK